ncbi:hypothetical protein F5876DRAFT_77776 [Lentinula aff. lateritia]|uniref:Uncharacterized protein n=1 Tax=Lentinula aff. lateritia TaxID=2804960 RepID=A0ACC1TYK5_9AGAR|nr:hypothetical protein F5876DRAFT_77776 [Lentinula aff. lateritia]
MFKIPYIAVTVVTLLTATYAIPVKERGVVRRLFHDMVGKGFVREINDTYKYTPEEMNALCSQQLSLSSKDYGPYFQEHLPVKVAEMSGLGKYKGHDRRKLIIKSFPSDKDVAALGEIQALRLMGDLVDFGKDSEGKPIIILKKQDGSLLGELEAYKTANDEQKRKIREETLDLACSKAASEAVHKGVWHNDNHWGNILITDVESGSVKSVKLIDYGGDFNNYLVYGEGRDLEHESSFVIATWFGTGTDLTNEFNLIVREQRTSVGMSTVGDSEVSHDISSNVAQAAANFFVSHFLPVVLNCTSLHLIEALQFGRWLI